MENLENLGFVKKFDTSKLKLPYQSIRHIAIFKEELDAVRLVSVLNSSVYAPVGLTKEEIEILVKDDRSKYFYRKKVNGTYAVYERLVSG